MARDPATGRGPFTSRRRHEPLHPDPGSEQYTIQVGWAPHGAFFATVVELHWDPTTDADNEPDSVRCAVRRMRASLTAAAVMS